MSRIGWTIAASLVVAASALTSSPVIAQEYPGWLRQRQERFAAFHAAHPDPDQQVVDIKATTAAMAAAHVEPGAAGRYDELAARSAALSSDDLAKTQSMDAAALNLWRAGDYDGAKEGFDQVLAIDPADGAANFYLGDIQQRAGDLADAAVSMDRAAVLAPGTEAAFKAAAALHHLPQPLERRTAGHPVSVWRTAATPVELWDEADTPEMIVIPPGEFMMGSPDSEAHHNANEEPLHLVRIGYAMAVSKYPVTVGEWARFVGATHYEAGDSCFTREAGSLRERDGRNWRKVGYALTPDSPVVCVSWNDAQAYVQWLSTTTGHHYRLLSEAEYEYVNRAGAASAYPWGDEVGAGHANCSLCGSAWDNQSTSPVGSFAPNAFGLYDTAGGVWSWVQDCANDSYASTPWNGSAAERGDCDLKGLRGGSWNVNPSDLRAAFRVRDEPGHRNSYYGFRVARTL